MPPTASYAAWSTGDDNNRQYGRQLLAQEELDGGDLWASGDSNDLETPAWDIEYSDNGPGAWDFDLSTQLAAKLLMIDSTAGAQLPDPDSDGAMVAAGLAAMNPRFKTEYCRNFKEKGTCMYGELCQFAHGRHELRKDVVRHNKYKTKLCQKFWIVGYCAYGPRCNFVHNEGDSGHQGSSGGSGGANMGSGSGKFREFHVSYRKTSLGDSGADSGSEHGSLTVGGGALGQLSPPHIFHPEDNPLPLVSHTNRHLLPADQGADASGLSIRRAWDMQFF